MCQKDADNVCLCTPITKKMIKWCEIAAQVLSNKAGYLLLSLSLSLYNWPNLTKIANVNVTYPSSIFLLAINVHFVCPSHIFPNSLVFIPNRSHLPLCDLTSLLPIVMSLSCFCFLHVQKHLWISLFNTPIVQWKSQFTPNLWRNLN